jgi:hypothetical protein
MLPRTIPLASVAVNRCDCRHGAYATRMFPLDVTCATQLIRMPIRRKGKFIGARNREAFLIPHRSTHASLYVMVESTMPMAIGDARRRSTPGLSTG